VIDLVGSFPFQPIFSAFNDGESNATTRLNRNLRLLRIIKLNRLLRLSRLAKNLKYIELALKFNPSAMRLIKLFSFMMLICHWLGCAWWFVADVELSAFADENGETPLVPRNDWQPSAALLQSETLGPQFSAAFFWGAGMVTAMIPYDIEPATEVEQFFTALCMFLGLILTHS